MHARIAAPIDEGAQHAAVEEVILALSIQARLKARNSSELISPLAIANSR
jgi:hypothetical protein